MIVNGHRCHSNYLVCVTRRPFYSLNTETTLVSIVIAMTFTQPCCKHTYMHWSTMSVCMILHCKIYCTVRYTALFDILHC